MTHIKSGENEGGTRVTVSYVKAGGDGHTMLSKAEFQQCYIAYYPERGWAGHVIEGMR